jgi:hypothetical protein
VSPHNRRMSETLLVLSKYQDYAHSARALNLPVIKILTFKINSVLLYDGLEAKMVLTLLSTQADHLYCSSMQEKRIFSLF